MSYCPQCGIEYDDEVEECVDCNGPLVEGSAEEMFDDIEDTEWVELDPLPTLGHAKAVKEELDQEDIPCYIQSFLSAGDDLARTNYGSQAIIVVPEGMYERALEIQQGITPPDDDQFLVDRDDYEE